MTRIAILGDTHGSMTRPHKIRKAMQDAEFGIVVGDFGYWPREPWWDAWIEELNAILRDNGKRLWFVDGNHEDFVSLKVAEAVRPRDEFGAIKISSQVAWFPRGSRWNWGGKEWLAMGGAPSIDQGYRLRQEEYYGKSRHWWFEEENITLSDIEAAGNKPVDYLVTHDGPRNIPMRLFPFGDMSRQMLSDLALEVKPSQWFHGHYHEFMAYDFPEYNNFCKVWALDESHGRDWYGILDTNSGIFAVS